MPMSRSIRKLSQAAALVTATALALPVLAETRVTTQPAAAVYAQSVQTMGPEVQGQIVNNTDAIVIAAELVVRHRWLWANETKPGADDPGWIDTYPLDITVPPGGSAPFRVQASRIAPQRTDGSFQTDAFVRSFKTIPSE